VRESRTGVSAVASGAVVAVVEYRDGTVIDFVRATV